MEARRPPVAALDSTSPPGRGITPGAKINGQKRKRHASSGSHASDMEEHGEHHKKRACNECRQQKLKCDVNPEPFALCSRCKRLKLECRIDANFKRVGKRSKTAQMEREIVELRQKLAGRESPVPSSPIQLDQMDISLPNLSTEAEMFAPHQGVAGSLLDLRHGTDASRVRNASQVSTGPGSKSLGATTLEAHQIEDLFKQYFQFYHPFLPVLDPDKNPDHYYELSPLLYWTIITVAARRFEDDFTLLTGIIAPFRELIWSTIAAVPQNYHVCKALALLCSWPLPTKSTSTDQTFLLSGAMMQIALQTGLHRPSYAQDFSKTPVELKEEDVDDRLRTWAICNIVVQTISTSSGLPPSSLYDYTLESLPEPQNDGNGLSVEVFWRLQIERFSNKVSQLLYNNKTDPIGIAGTQERAAWVSLLVEDYRDLEQKVTRHASPISLLHLQASGLHLRLAVFFDSYSAPNYVNDLLQVYFSATTFLTSARQLDTATSSALRYATRYIVHLILAGGFTLMKLLNSFFARHIEVEKSRTLFNTTIHGIRSISVTNNDLPARLAEVLAQLWRSYGAGMVQTIGEVDSSLQLKVRRRMSMSLVYDSVWRWREEFQFKGDGTTADLDRAVNNPTNPEDPADNDVGQAGLDPMAPDLSVPSAGYNDIDLNYDFDPLTWMLDGSIDFPYNGTAMPMDNPGLFD